jgi:hypothetical protein
VAFSSNAGAATFECALDDAPFTACSSPTALTLLSEGPHTLRVRARAIDGTLDPTSATATWIVDTIAPAVVISPDRGANAAGWYRAPVVFTTTGTDSGTAITCTSPQTYAGPDSTAASVSGACTDLAGNVGSSALPFKYDVTAPSVTATASRVANAAGWYTAPLTVSFAGPDATSGGVSCDLPKTYSGPDSATASVTGNCSDAAGNSGSGSFGFKYDATAPDTTLLTSPASPTGATTAVFTFSATEAGSTFSCKLDAAAAATCVTGISFSGLTSGPHVFTVVATDPAGNTDATAASFAWTVDSALPETAILSGPANPTSQTTASFTFTSSKPGSTFNCKLDAAAEAACNSGTVSYSGLAAGPHSFSVVATDLAGNVDPSPATYAWTVDTVAPDTTIATGPPPFSPAASATFTFTASEPGSSFACVLDGVSAPCSSPKGYVALAEGSHTFSVAAIDPAGNIDASPASSTWIVDTVKPDTTIASGPAASTTATLATFTFNSTEAGGFVCSLDGVSGSCLSPKAYSALAVGSHTFTVAAIDLVGNVDPTPANFTWTVTAPAAPETTITSVPSGVVASNSAVVAFSSNDAAATFECALDGAPFSACTSPTTLNALADGAHTFAVRAKAAGGTVDSTPATATWTVDTVAPETAIDPVSIPPNPSTSRAATFVLTSPDTTATFQCSLDAAAFAACTSPVPLVALADGTHTFRARAVDPAGNVDATPATSIWTIDTVAPTITYTARPSASTNSTSATFTWTSSEPATFTCKLDNVATTCGTVTGASGTKTFTVLQGIHTFLVTASDPAGNRTAAPVTWTVDTGPPDTDLQLPRPTNPTASTSATFTFTATEPGSSFTCQLDAAAATACNSGTITYTGLSSVSHTFSVFATDAAGNADLSPATFTWLVDATPPTGSITAPAGGVTVSSTVTVTGTAADNVSVLGVQFQLDGANLGAEDVSGPTYSVPWDTTQTSNGPHTLTAVIRDEVGNVTTTAPVQVTVANAAAPASGATVDVGPGFVDATTRQVIRTSAGRVYIIGADDTAAVNLPGHAATGPGVIRAYKGNQNGVPTAFVEVDAADHPCSGSCVNPTALSGVDARLGSDGVARTLFSDNSGSIGTLLFQTFSTATDTWGPTEPLDTGLGAMGRGRITYALALDSSNVPHVVYVRSGALVYRNRVGGVWSAPVTVASGGAIVHPMLAFDATGVLHLSWLNDAGSLSTVLYANRSAAGVWSAPETVAGTDLLSNINADQGPSIAVDSANNPYVLYVSASLGTFGPAGHTAQYGAIRIKKRIGGLWTFDNPTPDHKSHTPQIYMHGNDVYAFNGHDTDINFAYSHQIAGGAWSPEAKLTTLAADGSANIRWDPLHETDASIIDAAFYDEDINHNNTFLGEIYYTAVAPS